MKKKAAIFTSNIKWMKRIFIVFAISLFIFFRASAQVCQPMWADTGYGISPDTFVNLPVGYVGQAYEAVAQFKVPTSTVFNSSTVTVFKIALTNVEGLATIPASVPFTYACNPDSCIFHADSVGCVRITGTPTTAGTYDLIIDANVYVITPTLFVPYPTPGYHIIVYQNVDVPTISNSHFDVSQNTPNPFSNKTDIEVNLENACDFTVKISNLLGNQVLTKNISGRKGINSVSLDADALPPGIYFYTVSDGIHSITKRMNVDRK